jgi:hypothetical protein
MNKLIKFGLALFILAQTFNVYAQFGGFLQNLQKQLQDLQIPNQNENKPGTSMPEAPKQQTSPNNNIQISTDFETDAKRKYFIDTSLFSLLEAGSNIWVPFNSIGLCKDPNISLRVDIRNDILIFDTKNPDHSFIWGGRKGLGLEKIQINSEEFIKMVYKGREFDVINYYKMIDINSLELHHQFRNQNGQLSQFVKNKINTTTNKVEILPNYKCGHPNIENLIVESASLKEKSAKDVISANEVSASRDRNQDSNRSKSLLQDALPKAQAFSRESGSSWKLFEKKDELSGRLAKFARLDSKTEGGSIVTVEAKCESQSIGLKIYVTGATYPAVFTRYTGGFNVLGRIAINEDVSDYPFFRSRQFSNVIEFSMNMDKPSGLFLHSKDNSSFYVHRLILEIPTSNGKIIIRVPTLSDAIRGISNECV